MKNFAKILSVLLVAVMLVTVLVSCGNKANAIKKAFEKNDYNVAELKGTDEAAQTTMKLLLNEDQMKDAEKYDVIVVSMDGVLNVGKTGLIIKFPSSGDVKDFYTVEDKDGKKNTDAYDAAKDGGMINGNCVIFSLSKDTIEIFKNA